MRFLSAVLLFLAGCGGSQPAQPPAAINVTPAAAQPVAAPPSPVPNSAAKETGRPPATVAEATKVLDLASFPLLPGTPTVSRRQMAQLAYTAPSAVKAAYEFQKKHLIERGFKELPDPQLTDQYASGAFSKDGFTISVSVAPHQAEHTSVMLNNHGNVNLARLPVPPGANMQYSFPAVTSYVTTAPPAETAAAVRKLLLEQGWHPYGSAGDSQHFKQNAVELNARVVEHPAQPGKTFIDFSAQQLSADIPAPPAATSVQYADSNKRLDIYLPGTHEGVVAWYQTALAAAGWKQTTENPIKDGFEYFMVFRNPAKEMLTLTMWGTPNDQGDTRAHLVHQSAAEVEEEDRRHQAAVAAAKKKLADEQNKPQPKVAITLPPGAQSIEATAREIEFQVPSGRSKASLEALAKELIAAGFKAEDPIGEAVGGQRTFKKDGYSVSILYIDPGFIPAQITITGSGVELIRSAP